MTFAQVWTYLRWPLAIVGLLLVAQYALNNLPDAAGGMIEFDASGSILDSAAGATESEEALGDLPVAEPEAVPTLEPVTGPVIDGTAIAIADFHVDDVIADVNGEELVLGDGEQDSVVLAFEIPDGDPSCMDVNMTIGVSDVASPTEVGVFASTVDEPDQVVDNQEMAEDLRATQAPMVVALITEPGRLALDLTAGFQDYFTQDFPQGRPFVLTLAATSPVEPLGGVTFDSIESDSDSLPTLLWAGTPECGAAQQTEG